MQTKRQPSSRPLIQPSMREFWREARQQENFSWEYWLHSYAYGRFIYQYISMGVGEHWLVKKIAPVWKLFRKLRNKTKKHKLAADTRPRKKMADTYHGKVVPLEAAKQLVTVQQDIALPDLEKIVPYPVARDIILKNPDHIVALDCPCRSARENPCLPLDVCLVVGEPFATFIIEHHPEHSRWITQQEAETILYEEDQRGHVHHAFFKDVMLNRFYAICNCCSCCCGAIQSTQHGNPMLASSGYVAEIDETLCIGCMACEGFCQFDALHTHDEGYLAAVDVSACMGCGVCVEKCDVSAISLLRAPEKGEPLEICSLMEAVFDGAPM